MFPDLVIKNAFVFETFDGIFIQIGCMFERPKTRNSCQSFVSAWAFIIWQSVKATIFVHISSRIKVIRSVNCFVDLVLSKQYPCSRVACTWSKDPGYEVALGVEYFQYRRRSHGGTGGMPPVSFKSTSDRRLNPLINVDEAHVSNITSNSYGKFVTTMTNKIIVYKRKKIF
jgi:hypothetical protein